MSDGKTTAKTQETTPRPTNAPAMIRASSESMAGSRKVVVRATSTADDSIRDGVELGVVVFTSAAALIGLLVLGAVAERIGIDQWLGAGPLVGSLTGTFVTGAGLPLVMLQSLYGTGVADPLFFGAAMALAIPPIAGIVAARPRSRGAARPRSAVAAASGLTAALVVGADILIGIRASTQTSATIADSISDPRWAESLRDVAAADCVAMILAVLLAVLILRLPTERWVRGLAGTIAVATAVAAVGLAAASAGVVGMVEKDHPIVQASIPGSPPVLLVGTRGDGSTVGLRVDDRTLVLLGADTARGIVIDRRSISSVIDSATR
ncbi:MAG: hypothetical protein GY895_03250 [Phycisphaera sp.]|nr:hypothetical protein [Phycisphaera sp.]